mmetsp:Transcript_74518/g.210771  ORF Transcript_74518/g.210771 Transcript_74518/m.210771 type:complete len:207 (+) Transcript_74518:63-683(+)
MPSIQPAGAMVRLLQVSAGLALAWGLPDRGKAAWSLMTRSPSSRDHDSGRSLAVMDMSASKPAPPTEPARPVSNGSLAVLGPASNSDASPAAERQFSGAQSGNTRAAGQYSAVEGFRHWVLELTLQDWLTSRSLGLFKLLVVASVAVTMLLLVPYRTGKAQTGGAQEPQAGEEPGPLQERGSCQAINREPMAPPASYGQWGSLTRL